MKVDVLYTCDYCGRSYGDAERCRECEESHIKPKTFGKVSYHSFKFPKYPDCLEVIMGDGKVYRYFRGDD